MTAAVPLSIDNGILPFALLLQVLTCKHDVLWQGFAQLNLHLRAGLNVADLGVAGPRLGALRIWHHRAVGQAVAVYARDVAHADATAAALRALGPIAEAPAMLGAWLGVAFVLASWIRSFALIVVTSGVATVRFRALCKVSKENREAFSIALKAISKHALIGAIKHQQSYCCKHTAQFSSNNASF